MTRVMVWSVGERVWVSQPDGSYRRAVVGSRGHKGLDWYDVVYDDAPGYYDPVPAELIRKTRPRAS